MFEVKSTAKRMVKMQKEYRMNPFDYSQLTDRDIKQLGKIAASMVPTRKKTKNSSFWPF